MSQPAYMGGPINPQVSGPSGGLLQPSNYSYPLTSGLMSSLMQSQQPQQQPQSWSQLAYQMAGSPKQGGMYSPVGIPALTPGTGGSSSSAGALAGLLPLLGGLLGGGTATQGSSSGGLLGALKGLLGGSAVPGSMAANGGSGTPINILDPGQLSDPVPADLGGLAQNNVPDLSDPANNAALTGNDDDWLSQLYGPSSAGGQATNPVQPITDDGGLFGSPQSNGANLSGLNTPASSGPSFSQVANTGLAGLGLFNAASAGNGLGIAGAGASLARDLGVPGSLTNPVSTGASLAGLGMNLATGNYLPAAGGLLGLGGAAAKVPSDISQPLSLLLSVLTGNPIGMGVNAAKVGSGLLNVLGGRNYDGSWTPDPAALQGISDQTTSQLVSATNAKSGNVTDQLSANPEDNGANINTQIAPTFTPDQLAKIGQQQSDNFGNYILGQGLGPDPDNFHSGIAPIAVEAAPGSAFLANTMQNALSQAQGNPALSAYIQRMIAQQNGQQYVPVIQNS